MQGGSQDCVVAFAVLLAATAGGYASSDTGKRVASPAPVTSAHSDEHAVLVFAAGCPPEAVNG